MKSFRSFLITFGALLACLPFAGLFSSCDVHELPDIHYGEVDFTLHLEYEGDMPLYQEITYTRADASEAPPHRQTHQVRYQINVYPHGSIVSSKTRADNLCVKSFCFTSEMGTTLDKTVSLELPEGEWDLYVWTDFVDPGSNSDKYYDTTDWSNITYPDKKSYTGDTAAREAFRGMATVTVNHPYRYLESEPKPDNSATVFNVRPMARYEFISTDVDEFVKQMSKAGALEESPEKGDAYAPALTPSDLAKYRVVFRYTTFMPSVYNLFQDKPIDSWTGMSYESAMELTPEGIRLGFDHVFINGSESIVNVAAEVYNEKGEMIASTRTVDVPLKRGKYTVVKGEFLTSQSSGGVGIQPGYDGEYNVELR